MGNKKELATKILLLHCVLSVIFIAVFIFLTIYTSNDKTCATDEYIYYDGVGVNSLTGYELNTEDAYMLQDFGVYTNYIKYKFCFGSVQSSSNGLKVQIINEKLDTLAELFIDNRTTYSCTYIQNASLVYDYKYIGILCENCNTSQNITLQYPNLADDKEVIYFNNENTEVNPIYQPLSNTVGSLKYDIYAFNSCRNLTKFFMWTYINISLVFLFIFILFIGFNFMHDSTEEMFRE